jgi:hypothetical protein
MKNDTWYVSHKGHPYATTAIPFKSLEAAETEAKRSCVDAMRTEITYVKAGSYSGEVVQSYNRSGRLVF